MVKKAGYDTAVTTYYGRHNNAKYRHELRRIIISTSDTLREFQLKLTGYYDWLMPKECIIHSIRSVF